MRSLLVLLTFLLACGPGSPGGPTLSGKMADDDPPPPELQSNDILERDAVTKKSKVKHILISWKELGDDERAKQRSRAEADALAKSLYDRVVAGEEIEPLMAEFSEDPGSAQSGIAYDVSPSAQLVFEFRRMGLRLNVGETGLVLTQFGWHVMKRVE
jgi:parvulin-like peptidyl-prolyl isomerase